MTRVMHGKFLDDDDLDAYSRKILSDVSAPDRMKSLEWLIQLQTSRMNGSLIRFIIYSISGLGGIPYFYLSFIEKPTWGSGIEFIVPSILFISFTIYDCLKYLRARELLREAIVCSVMES